MQAAAFESLRAILAYSLLKVWRVDALFFWWPPGLALLTPAHRCLSLLPVLMGVCGLKRASSGAHGAIDAARGGHHLGCRCVVVRWYLSRWSTSRSRHSSWTHLISCCVRVIWKIAVTQKTAIFQCHRGTRTAMFRQEHSS